MTFRFTRKQLLTLLLSIVLIGCVLYLISLLFLSPTKTNIEQLQSSINTEQKLLDIVANKQPTDKDTPVVSSTEIQKKIPVIPLLEQLIYELERAETMSESRILNMSFSENDFAYTGETTDEQQTEGEENTGTEAGTEEAEENENKPEQASIDPELASGLKQITIALSVESPSYEDLEKFLSSIEHQTRITKVDSLSFSGQPEITTADQETSELMTYSITITSFYMPVYSELALDAPKIDIPAPGNKKNPLATGIEKQDTEVQNDEDQSNEVASSSVPEDTNVLGDSKNYKVLKHKVKAKETLFMISMKYYKNRSGEELIRLWNNLDGNKIRTGQVLEIPIEKK